MVVKYSNKREVHDLKASLYPLNSLKKNFMTLKTTARHGVIPAKTPRMMNSLQKCHLTPCNYLEGHSRRSNIVIGSINDSASEKWPDSEDKVKKLLSEKL